MAKRIAGLAIIVCAVVMAVALQAGLAGAQGQSTQIVVLQAVRHAVSPPLYQIPPSPPEQAVRHAIPLRPTHPIPLPFAPRLDPALQQPGTASPLAATAGLGFLGIGEGLGNYSVGYIPPDTNGAAGATQYVQWVNASYAVFDKSTGALVLGPNLGNTLWQSLGGACATYNSGDPIAQYDKQAGRWVMMQPVFTKPYYLCIAVSKTSDATGKYNLYQFAVPNNMKYFPDYPKLAVWPDGYYISFNTFQGNSYLGPTACVADRSSMLANGNATMQCTSPLGAFYGTMLPSDLDGAIPNLSGTTAAPPSGAPDYYLNFGSNSLNLWTFHVDWSNVGSSSFNGPVSVSNVAAFNEACGGGACIPQPGTNNALDSLGDRLMYRLAYRNFGTYQSLVASQSVDTGNGNTGVRWYEIRSPGSSPAVYQQGTYSPDYTNSRWMPSIAMDKLGDVALGYSESSSGMYPAIYFTGRTPSDSLGNMEAETNVINGTGSQTTYSRWGDYSGMSVDPTNDCTFWYTNEYLKTTGVFNWSTQIASFAFPGCSSGSSSPTVSSVSLNPSSVTGGSSSTGTVTLSAAAPSGGISVSLSSSNTSAAQVPSIVTVASGATSANFNVTTSSVASTTSVTITASYNSSSAQATLTVNPPTSGGGDFSISALPLTQTVSRNSSTSYTVTVTPASGFTGSVNLSVSGVPPQSSASFSPATITGGSGTSTLTVSIGNHTPTKTYTLTITGTSGSLAHSTQVSLTVH